MTKFLHTGEITINLDAIAYVTNGDGGEHTAVVLTSGRAIEIPFPLGDVIDALHGAWLLPWSVVTVQAAAEKGRKS